MLIDQLGVLDSNEIDAILHSHVERRASPRFPYRVTQMMAPIRRGIQGPFRDVNCSDLSAGGISFYLDYPPDFDTFIIILENGQEPIHMLGKVLACEQSGGMPIRLVRCQFIRRLEATSATS